MFIRKNKSLRVASDGDTVAIEQVADGKRVVIDCCDIPDFIERLKVAASEARMRQPQPRSES